MIFILTSGNTKSRILCRAHVHNSRQGHRLRRKMLRPGQGKPIKRGGAWIGIKGGGRGEMGAFTVELTGLNQTRLLDYGGISSPPAFLCELPQHLYRAQVGATTMAPEPNPSQSGQKRYRYRLFTTCQPLTSPTLHSLSMSLL